MRVSDEELARRARRGSRDATSALLERHWRRAWQLAYAVVGTHATADDVAHEAWERALRGLPKFNGASSFSTWMTRIVVNCAINALRRERAAARRVAPMSLERAWHDAETSDPRLVAAVGGLRWERRVIVVLRYWLEWTPTEIAELLDVPVGTVNSRLTRALAELRTRLEVDDADRA